MRVSLLVGLLLQEELQYDLEVGKELTQLKDCFHKVLYGFNLAAVIAGHLTLLVIKLSI